MAGRTNPEAGLRLLVQSADGERRHDSDHSIASKECNQGLKWRDPKSQGWARLSARIDPDAGFSEQKSDRLPRDAKKAISLLKRAELDFVPSRRMRYLMAERQRGFGAGYTRNTGSRGDLSNCQVRLVYKNGYLAAL